MLESFLPKRFPPILAAAAFAALISSAQAQSYVPLTIPATAFPIGVNPTTFFPTQSSSVDGDGNTYRRTFDALNRVYFVEKQTKTGSTLLIPTIAVPATGVTFAFTVDAPGNIYVARSTGSVEKHHVSADYKAVETLASNLNINGSSIAFDSQGYLYMTSVGFGFSVLVPRGTGPRIVLQPQPTPITSDGGTASLTVAAVDTSIAGSLNYQWYLNGTAVSGATLANYQAPTPGLYTVAVSNPTSSITSAAATVTALIPPSITTQPTAVTTNAGRSVSFTVVAAGAPSPSFQWRKDNTPIDGATSATLTLANVQTADVGSYHVIVTNPSGSVASSAATLTLNLAPVLTARPANQTVAEGSSTTFSVATTSTPSPTYQWQKDGVDLPGATSATLVLPTTRPTDAGNYTVVVTSSAGLVTTSSATLTVSFSRLINISTRGIVPAGGSLTPGFVLRGSGTKRLVVRGIGPTLAAFAIASSLDDPVLSIFPQGSSTPTASNDDWNGASGLDAVFASVGAFPLHPAAKDAAVLATLPCAGLSGYSVRITANSTTTSGVALAEIYDTDAVTAPVRIANVSTLGFVGTGANILTAGFVIQGTATKQLLIRAVGPGLAAFGATGLLATPSLEIIASGRSEPLADNRRWGGTPALKVAFTHAGAFALADDSNDAALLVQLAPGGYTVQVAGVAATTGNALLEIYDLDP